MKKKLKAVLFDMDGVLFDSMPYHSEAWHKVMKSHGLTLSREEAYMHEGRTGASTINIVFQRELGREATHNSSPRISGIMISERTSSGQYSLIIINASFPLAQTCTLYIEDNELTR